MKVTKSKIFEVYETQLGRHRVLLTKNLNPRKKVYGERLFKDEGVEYREWNPERSKLAAAIVNGSPNVGIRAGDVVLYLGSSTGTTVSHVSDMVGPDGFIFGVDPAPRVMREFVFLCEDRTNIAPVLGDANNPLSYADRVCMADIIFQDVAQRNQLDIFLKNMDMFLKDSGYGLLAIKARSIDVTKNPQKIFKAVRAELEKHVTIIDYRDLDPIEKDHCFFVCKKK